MDGFAFAELYVNDADSAVEHFTGQWDLSLVARAFEWDRTSVLLRGGDVQVVISTPSGRYGPVAEWLKLHGDGVADVGMYLDDVPAALARALSASLPVLRRADHGPDGTISGVVGDLGALRHTLIQAAGACQVPPPGFDWIPAGPDPYGPPEASRLGVIDHVAICLAAGTLEATTEVYRRLFGLTEYSSDVIDEVNAHSRVLHNTRGITYVFAEPISVALGGQIEAFIEATGDSGVQHLALSAGGLAGAVAAYRRRGVRFCATPDAYYENLPDRLPHHPEVVGQVEDLRAAGVLVAAENGGLLKQIFAAPALNGQIFLELIERTDGAQGFGNANIVELFRAHDRETATTTGEGPGLDLAG